MRITPAGVEHTKAHRVAVSTVAAKRDAAVIFLSTLHALRAFPRRLIFRKFRQFGAGPAQVDWQLPKHLPTAVKICVPGSGASVLPKIEPRQAALRGF
jgi:hypothetical protein